VRVGIYWSYFHSLNLKWKWEAIITISNIAIITWWPFISHSLGSLVKAGVVKVTQAFIFLSVWKGHFCWLWTLRRELCVLTLPCYFSSFFSCIRISDCPGTVTQSALRTHKRALTVLCDFVWSVHDGLWKALTAVINVIFFLMRENKILNQISNSGITVVILYFKD